MRTCSEIRVGSDGFTSVSSLVQPDRQCVSLRLELDLLTFQNLLPVAQLSPSPFHWKPPSGAWRAGPPTQLRPTVEGCAEGAG